MDCVNCGAPLPPKSNVCKYCKTLNDTDLRSLKGSKSKGGTVDRRCPRCRIAMQSVRLGLATPIHIERCTKCHGIFFDPGELEEVLDASVKKVYEVDLERIDTMLREETPQDDFKAVTYVPCPDCDQFMHRKSYGARSGVIVDRCREHGAWLDGGELTRLLEWSKAGGRKHDRQETVRREADQARAEKSKELFRYSRLEVEKSSGSGFTAFGRDADDQLPGLLHVIARLIG
jgi:Zn-finger nucleic acid-binding protein